MKRARMTYLPIVAFLLLPGALAWAGCGGEVAATEGQGVLAGELGSHQQQRDLGV